MIGANVAPVRHVVVGATVESEPWSPKLDTTSDRKPQSAASDDHGHQVGHIVRRVQGGKELMMRGKRARNDVEGIVLA